MSTSEVLEEMHLKKKSKIIYGNKNKLEKFLKVEKSKGKNIKMNRDFIFFVEVWKKKHHVTGKTNVKYNLHTAPLVPTCLCP